MYQGLFEYQPGESKKVHVRLVLEGIALWQQDVTVEKDDRHQAYYVALRDLVKEVVNREIQVIEFIGLDDLVAKQVIGTWKVSKARLSRLCIEIRSYLPMIGLNAGAFLFERR